MIKHAALALVMADDARASKAQRERELADAIKRDIAHREIHRAAVRAAVMMQAST